MIKKPIFAALLLFVSAAFLVGCNTDAQTCFEYEPVAPTAGQDINFTNCTVFGNTYEWDFGDGNTSTETNPVHAYDSAGTYKVVLTAYPKNGNSGTPLAKNVTVN